MKKRDSSKDPFLEDEGFAPSDISGTTTPRKDIPVSKNKTIERKDSFKLARTSASQERKIMGTPKRTENITQLQKQIITPNENVKESDIMKSVPTPEEHSNSIPAFKKMDSDKNKIESAKKTLFVSEKKPTSSLFGNVERSVSTPPFSKPKEAVEEVKEDSTDEKKEKPVIKHLFGPSKEIIDELRKSRQSNNSSPSFGETKNSQTASSDEKSASTVKKPISLFAPKASIIKESPEEEEQASHEDNPVSSNKLTVLSSGTNESKSPEEKLETPKKTDIKASNPFLSNDPSKAKNLFSSGISKSANSEPVKMVSLFNKTPEAQVGLFGIKGNHMTQEPRGPNISMPPLFRSHSFGIDSSFNNTSCIYSSFIAKPVPNANIKVSSNIDLEDVGMGGVTPPNQSPIQQPIEGGKMFPFGTTQRIGNSLFGHQGTSGASYSIQPKTSLFGNASSTPSGPMFNIGTKSDTKPLFSGTGATGGSMFASGPSQGQPEPAKSTWTNDPFVGKKKNNKKEDDGLFSDLKR
jgi:hypothetical protein